MNQVDENIYGGIFDIAKQNMTQSNNAFNFSKKEFLLSIEGDPNCVNMLDLIELNNHEFMFLSYVLLLQRLPDEVAYQSWGKVMNLPKEEFQKLLTENILRAQEFDNKKINVRNNYTGSITQKLIEQTPSLITNNNNLKYHRLRKTWLLNIYRHAPVKLKVMIRKILGFDMI